MKLFRKTLALVLCAVMLVCVLTACGKNGTTTTSTVSGNTASSSGDEKLPASKVKLTYPEGNVYHTNTVDLSWEGLEEGETLDLKIEKKDGDKYTTVLEKAGLTGDSFKSDDKLSNETVYKITLIVNEKGGKKSKAALECTAVNFIKNTTINAGMDFTFKGKISETVLNNYLSRAITYTNANSEDAMRAILNTGTKYVCRAAAEWYPSEWFETRWLPHYKELLAKAHAVDPEIVFEGCIFETTGKDLNTIKIPAFVFEAFGQKVENRCFNHKKMLFPSGHGLNMWADGYSLPDITQLETQMFVYYRATKFIDAGFEALHLGQTKQTGRDDTNYECWTKVINLIRQYASKHARRNYVIINSHHPSHDFKSANGVMLVDFNMSPLRPKAYRKAGEPLYPQKCVLDTESDAPYGKGYKGTSPSGWTTNHYPYLLEFDNYAPDASNDVWEMDEISWIVSQPDDYRRSFQTEVRKMVAEFKDNGHVALIAKRSTSFTTNGVELYIMNNSKYCEGGFDDEDAIIAAFKAYK